MCLTKLEIYNVRNIVRASLKPSPTLNFIVGDNASGKSSLLEAIYILGRLKSFRTNNLSKVINFDVEQFIISAQIANQNHASTNLGVQLDHDHFETHFNQQSVKTRSQFAYALPLQFIHPKSYKLLDAGPQLRREYIDWGLFNTDKAYLEQWRRFKKALSQRNVLLKKRQLAELTVWDKEVAKYGTILTQYRRGYLEQLKPIFFDVAKQFLVLDELTINFYPGWDDSKDYEQGLKQSLDKDLRYGYSTCGPHHSDFKLYFNKKLAKEYVSRGQLKLLVLALKLAQVKHLQNQQNLHTCLLIDDLASELDMNNRQKLLSFLAQMKMQVFITATEFGHFGDVSHYSSSAMFHVEHGGIQKVNDL